MSDAWLLDEMMRRIKALLELYTHKGESLANAATLAHLNRELAGLLREMAEDAGAPPPHYAFRARLEGGVIVVFLVPWSVS